MDTLLKLVRNILTRSLAWRVLGVSLAVALLAAACTLQQDVPSLERRAQKLNKVIMCPVCPGESIDQSQNDLAVKMRGIVDEKLEQGWTEAQIKAFFVEGYGPSVLLEPPRKGFSLTVWIIPPVAIFVAGLMLYLVLRWMRRSPARQPEPIGEAVQLSDAELADYFRRIESALGYDGDRVAPSEHEEAPGSQIRGGD